MIRIIVFDFDGTLVDSNHVKTEAWRTLFTSPQEQAALDTVLARHLEESRYTILDEFYKLIGVADPTQRVALVTDKANEYGNAVLEGVLACREMPGSTSMLKTLHGAHTMYISSNSPHKDLLRIIPSRGWSHFFKRIYGFPSQKPQTIRDVLAEENADPDEVVVVGDGHSDRNAAREVGCPFIQAGPGLDLSALPSILSRH